jgi:hypothetical protein
MLYVTPTEPTTFEPMQALLKQVADLALEVQQLREQVQSCMPHSQTKGPSSHQGPMSGPSSPFKANKPSCTYCGRVGHQLQDCFKRKRQQQVQASPSTFKEGEKKPAGSNLPRPLN